MGWTGAIAALVRWSVPTAPQEGVVLFADSRSLAYRELEGNLQRIAEALPSMYLCDLAVESAACFALAPEAVPPSATPDGPRVVLLLFAQADDATEAQVHYTGRVSPEDFVLFVARFFAPQLRPADMSSRTSRARIAAGASSPSRRAPASGGSA